jgi:hypothetical protein
LKTIAATHAHLLADFCNKIGTTLTFSALRNLVSYRGLMCSIEGT